MPNPNTEPRALTLEQWAEYGEAHLCRCGHCAIMVKGYYLDRNKASPTYLKLLPKQYAKGHSIAVNRRKRKEIQLIR